MSAGEKQGLLNQSSVSAHSTTTTTDENPNPPPYSETDTAGTAGEAGRRKGNGASKQHGKLQRKSSLDKVEEDQAQEAANAATVPPGGRYPCPSFGVRNYMHEFYDRQHYKDPNVYEDEDDFRLLLNPHPRRRSCTSIWWKVFVWIGANFLVFGIIGVLVGYLVPQRPIIIGSIAENIEIIDREAISFNFNLDVCKLVGLILFCIGGLTLTVALLFPSFLYSYCESGERGERPRVPDDSDCPYSSSYGDYSFSTSKDYGCGPTSPIDKSVPLKGKLATVQPERKEQEALVTQGKLVSIKD